MSGLPSEEMKSLSLNSFSKSTSASSSSPTLPMTAEQRFQIVRSLGEECIHEDELLNLLSKEPQPIFFDCFEPSGRIHIAQGVMKTINVTKLTAAGCKVKILINDVFAHFKNKMSGDLEKIQTVGHYFIEICKAVGMDLEGDKVEFLWSTNDTESTEYDPAVLKVSKNTTLLSAAKAANAIGPIGEEKGPTPLSLRVAWMQGANIIFHKADICQMGIDQRTVNALAREYCDLIKKENKPVFLSDYMLPGLQQGQDKMSKSDPHTFSYIFMDDEEAEVNMKINDAYCPPNVVEGNPCLYYIKFIIFGCFNEFKVERSQGNGGDRIFTSFEELVAEYASGELQAADLKPALSKSLNNILQPVRDHFKNDANAKELLKQVKAIGLFK